MPWKEGSRVHTGFVQHLSPVREELGRIVGELGDSEVVFTEDSLGAAVATLAASLWPRASLFTFGPPRVGDAAFGATFPVGRVAQRFVNCCDLVCRVPPEGLGFVLVGALRYLDRNGALRMEPTADDIRRDQRLGSWQYLTRHAWVFWRNVLTRRLAGHSPINYGAAVP